MRTNFALTKSAKLPRLEGRPAFFMQAIAMAKAALSINLLETKGEPFIDKFLRWTLSIGRAIVILTEVIALSAFVYRFSIDRRIVDLSDEIKQKQLIMGQLDRPERLYRNLQARLSAAKRLEQSGPTTTRLLNDIITLAQGRIRFNSLSVSDTTIKINGSAPSTAQLNFFIKELREQPKIAKISIDRLDNRTSQASIDVTITAELDMPVKKQAAAPKGEVAL
jgi:hypothetical protein